MEAVEAPLSLAESIGPVTLGDVDPRTLTQEGFSQSPHLLLHGNKKIVPFSHTYDYRSEQAREEMDASETLGIGFYATDSREAAENYSKERQGGHAISAFVTELLPFQAKMFDFRLKSDPTKLAPVPQDLLRKWQEYVLQYDEGLRRSGYSNWTQDPDSLDKVEYRELLKDLVEKGQAVKIRDMLGTGSGRLGRRGISPTRPFDKFMLGLGFDGIIALEGGEGAAAKPHTSFVFFNPKVVGTYGSWHAASKTTPEASPAAA